jgi:uncharacterized protein YdaU (DUF1376 family)
MEKRDIAYIHINNYLSSTQELTAVEHGAYIFLLMQSWRNSNKIDRDPLDRGISKLSEPNRKAMIYVLTKYFILENREYRIRDQFKDVIK